MKISKKQLRQIIREEYTRLKFRRMLNESAGKKLQQLNVDIAKGPDGELSSTFFAVFKDGSHMGSQERSIGHQAHNIAAENMKHETSLRGKTSREKREKYGNRSRISLDMGSVRRRGGDVVENFCNVWAGHLSRELGIDVSSSDLMKLHRSGQLSVSGPGGDTEAYAKHRASLPNTFYDEKEDNLYDPSEDNLEENIRRKIRLMLK